MTGLLIEISMNVALYKLKEGTSTSYYWQEGSKILPNRLSISFGTELTHAERKGRMLLEDVIGEVKGNFTRVEQSPLKQHPPFSIHSKIFRPLHFPSVFGYAVMGISNEEGCISRNSEEGLAVFCKVGEGELKVFFWPGITNPSEKDDVLEFVTKKEGWPEMTIPRGYKK